VVFRNQKKSVNFFGIKGWIEKTGIATPTASGARKLRKGTLFAATTAAFSGVLQQEICVPNATGISL
jgi:hypothetical protein